MTATRCLPVVPTGVYVSLVIVVVLVPEIEKPPTQWTVRRRAGLVRA
jgi:hypothetical protein